MSFAEKIHKQTISNPVFLIVGILVFLSFRFSGSQESSLLELLGTFGVQLCIAFFMIYINQVFVIIRQRTFLPAFFYLLFSGTNESLFSDYPGAIFAFLVSLCLFILFSTYQNPHSQAESLFISTIIAASSLFWTPILFLFPVFWYGLFALQSLNLRTFFASLSGIILILSGIVCWSLIVDDKFSFAFIKSIFFHYQSIGNISLIEIKELHEWIYFGVLILLIILSGVNILSSNLSEKVRSIIILNFLYLFLIISLIFVIFQSSSWMSILYIPLSFLLGHYFTLVDKKWSNWLFIFIIVFFISFFFKGQILQLISSIGDYFSILVMY